MPTLIEPVEAIIVLALVRKLITNNLKFWECVGCSAPNPEPEREDSNSDTTSISDVAVHVHYL